MARLRGRVEDGWCTFSGLVGWERYRVAVQAAVVAGRPSVTALKVEPDPGAGPSGLTGARLKSLPLGEMATLALAATHTGPTAGDLRAAMRRAARPTAALHDPRAAVTVEQVAAVWQLAYDAGKAPRAAVVEQLSITPRTADRYIARARDAGLIADPRRQSAADQARKERP